MFRSVLYVPADRPKMLAKAAQRQADLVLVDLEDAVPLGSKELARQQARAAIPRLKEQGAQVGVRINSHPDLLGADLEAMSGTGVDIVVVPKAELHLIETADNAADVEGADLMALVESGRGLRDAPDLAAHPRVVLLMAGEFDLGADLGISATADHPVWIPFWTRLVWASAAAGIDGPVGSIYANLAAKDHEELRTTTKALAELGFTGRSAIHPAHVPVINQVFTPSASELETARRLVETYDRALRSGRGVIVDEHGQMIDEAMVRRSRKLVARYRDGFDGGA